MVPCFNQSNLCIQRKLREWKTQKSYPCFGAESSLRILTCKLPVIIPRRVEPTVQICRNSGLPSAMIPCLHQSNLYIKRKLREWRTQKCNTCFGAISLPRSTDLANHRFQAAPYRADSANLRKLGATFRLGTVFAPNQYLYGKEATGMESPKM